MKDKSEVFKPYICSECHKPCMGTVVDFGIGPYEFQGQRGNQVDKQWVSECCEADIEDEDGNAAEPPDYDEDYDEREPAGLDEEFVKEDFEKTKELE